MRRIINILLATLLLSSFTYTILANYLSRSYKYCFIYPGYINAPYSKMPVFFGGADIGCVEKISNYGIHHNQCVFILNLKSMIDIKHISATITTINFLTQDRAIVLEWDDNIYILDKINNIPQIYYKSALNERIAQALTSISAQDFVGLCKNINTIINHLKESSIGLTKLINSLNVDIFNDEIKQQFAEHTVAILSNLHDITSNVCNITSKDNCRNIQLTINNIHEVSNRLQRLVTMNQKNITRSIQMIRRCVEAFSKKPLQFLKNGIQK